MEGYKDTMCMHTHLKVEGVHRVEGCGYTEGWGWSSTHTHTHTEAKREEGVRWKRQEVEAN